MTSLKIAVGTFFGTGLLPGMPGTWGSFFCLPLIYFTALCYPLYGVGLFVLIACLLSLWSTSAAVEKYGEDPPQFVMDECAGQAIVFLFTGFTFTAHSNILVLFAGFVLFRLFDILKPLGINALQKLPGKFGILTDDLLAGTYALICLELLKIVPVSL